MFCGNCGTEVKNGTMFCPNCGGQISDVFLTLKQNSNRDSKAKKIAISASIGSAILILTILIVSLVVGNGGYIKTLNNYYKAHENNDADLMYSSVIAQYWIDYTNEAWGNSAFESIQDSIKDRIDDWDCGDNIKITYEVENERRATKKQLEGLEDNIYDWYAYYVYKRDEFSITDAYVLDINFTVKGDKGTENFHYSDGLLVIKENGKWRIPRGSISCSFYDNQ